MDWLRKLAGYAPDIALAIGTGGASLAVTGLRILGKELLGDENATEAKVSQAIAGATPERMVELTRVNNEFRLEKRRIEAKDAQAEHTTTQETIRNGDNSDSRLVRWTRPLQSWCALVASFFYVFTSATVSMEVLLVLMALPFAYAGLRQVGKWKTATALQSLGGKKGG